MTEMKEVIQYNQNLSLESRKEKSAQLLQKYPNRYPVVLLKKLKAKLPDLTSYKFLVEKSLTISNLMATIRKDLNLGDKQSLFLIVKNKIPTGTQTISSIYQECKDEDGFLYIIYASEDPFGSQETEYQP